MGFLRQQSIELREEVIVAESFPKHVSGPRVYKNELKFTSIIITLTFKQNPYVMQDA